MSEPRLPRSIRNQIQAAEQIQAEITAAQAQQAEQVLTPVEALNPEPEPSETPTAITPATVETPVPPAKPSDELALAEQRYRTLQGMVEHDLGTLRQQVKQGNQRGDELAATVERLKKELQEPRPQSQVMDPKDVEAFGADLVDMVRRQASAEIAAAVQAEVSAVVARLEGLESKLHETGQSVAVNAEHQFYVAVTAQVPDWRVVNADQRFLTWLGEVDPVYGVPRQVALDNAVNKGSVDHTAAIFNAFKSTLATAPVPANDLRSQTSPSRSGNSSAPAAAAQIQIVSQKDISDFYSDVSKRRYVGREAEMNRIEANINQAIAEGRVR